MPGKLKALMAMATTSRTTEDYESVMDDFVVFAGGQRLESVFEIPDRKLNADYYFDCGEFDCIMESKQARAYDGKKTVQSFFDQMFREGRIILPPGTTVGSQMTVDNTNMSASDWAYFYKKFRPSIIEHLNQANLQLRATDAWLPKRHPSRVKAVFVLNSGDFNLPIDLLGRIIVKKVQSEWRKGHFSSIDFAVCGAFDMYRAGEHPLRAHHLVRDRRPELEGFARYLYDKWIRYAAAELDLQVEFTPNPNASTMPEYREVVEPYRGKLRLRSG